MDDPERPCRIFYWINHTGAYEGNSGVQRVTRMLARGFVERGTELVFVGWSPKDFALVRSDAAALHSLAQYDGPDVPGQAAAGVPIHLNDIDQGKMRGSWLLVPEVTHQQGDLTRDIIDYARTHDLKVAFVFYDLIPLLQEGYDDLKGLHERYVQQLALSDLIIPISRHSGATLLKYYEETEGLPLHHLPQIAPSLLGETFTGRARPQTAYPQDTATIKMSALGTIEPRKNQVGLLRAFNRLCRRRRDLDLSLTVVGHLHSAVAKEFNALVAANPKVTYLGYRSDEEVAEIYRRSHFTIFPSIEEGYGLPIVESLWFGRPNICADFGSMAEVSAGGGCLTIDTRSELKIERAIEMLADDSAARAELAQQARDRSFKTWSEYAAEIEARLRNHVPIRRVYLWCELIVGQPFNTGVQRVVRSTARAIEDLDVELVCIRWDHESNDVRCLNDQELDHLGKWNGPRRRARVQLPKKFDDDWLIIPEVMVPIVPEDGSLLSRLHARGLRVCSIFYDLIPHKMPENYPPVAQDYFARYWRSIADSDLILGISRTVSDEAYEYYLSRLPKLNNLRWRIRPALLAGEFPDKPRSFTPPQPMPGRLRLLNVGTIEPRKNQFRLIEAIEDARQRSGIDITVTFVGRGGAFPELDERMKEASAKHPWITRLEHVADDVLDQLYSETDITAFASFEEGFGLPVLESLWACRPCLCHNDGAIREVANGGGCLTADMLDDAALADALVRLATDPDLVRELAGQACERSIRTWKEYATDMLNQMASVAPRSIARVRRQAGLAPIAIERLENPILSIAVTTYNRGSWLRHTLPAILELTRPYRDVIEVLVCDNASTDDTPSVIEQLQREDTLVYHRNAKNVGMLGNLGVTARHASGEFVWVIGDDDLMVPGVIENVLEGILNHPESEIVYLNYAYTNFDKPADISHTTDIFSAATAIAEGGANRFVEQLREVASLNENYFTAIYACIFRRRHALLGYGQDVSGQPFSSLSTCVPSTVYSMKRLLNLPAYWIGEPGVVVNMNVSWLKWALLWHLERMPELYDWVEREGMGGPLLDNYRWSHAKAAAEHVRAIYFNVEPALRAGFDIERFVAQCMSLPAFRADVLPGVMKAYEEAFADGKTHAGSPPPKELAEKFGLGGLGLDGFV